MILHMRTDDAMENLLRSVKAQITKGDGYSVSFMLPFGIRYCTADKRLTLLTEVKQRNRWLFSSFFAVYVESPITWDNEDEPLPPHEAERVITRIKEALDKRLNKHYELQSGYWAPES